MRTEDWTKEEWEMTVQLERITAQNAEEKHQELSKRRKVSGPRRTKKDWLRYAANLAAVAVLLYFLVNGTILFVFRALWTALEKGLLKNGSCKAREFIGELRWQFLCSGWRRRGCCWSKV